MNNGNYFKYPRTPHLPFSEGVTDDDKRLSSDLHFEAFKEVVITVKMDGENTTVYPDGYCHARSIDSKHQPYHSYLLRDIQNWAYQIPPQMRVCGEYLYAKHSIAYDSLDAFFMAFSVWQNNLCLSWENTMSVIETLGIHHVPVIYIGKYNSEFVENLAKKVIEDGHEGIVVRNAAAFDRNDFEDNIAKYVRPNHVQTDKHWQFAEIEPNHLSTEKLSEKTCPSCDYKWFIDLNKISKNGVYRIFCPRCGTLAKTIINEQQ